MTIQAKAQIGEGQNSSWGFRQGDVRAPHQPQGDRIKARGGEDACKQIIHTQPGVDQAGNHASQAAKQDRQPQGHRHRGTLADQHRSGATSQGKGAIHREVWEVENAQRQVGAQGQAGIGQALVVGTNPKRKHGCIVPSSGLLA